jgi:two-component system sensor histidine kinase AlgZ
MRNKIIYRCWQALFWGGYTGALLIQTVKRTGWELHIIFDYLLFVGYCIALTEFLRREILRRGWLDGASFRTVALALSSAVPLGAVQTLLVVTTDIALSAGQSYFIQQPVGILWTWLGVGAMDLYWIGIYSLVKTRSLGKEKQVRLELALREAELRALEAQINPHFLFNCLNSIRGLVVEDPQKAQEMITRFATLLRYNLTHDSRHTVPLSAEAEVVADYLALEKVRFEDRLRLQVTIDPAAASLPVPPMILQSLVENALKHGIARLPQGGDLQIRAAARNGTLVLEVENTGELTDSRSTDTQVGLNNIRERLRILYGDRASLALRNSEGGHVVATVQIPKVP